MKPGACDSFKRNFIGDVAQCGCRWRKATKDEPVRGDVLELCVFHKQVSVAMRRKRRAEKS